MDFVFASDGGPALSAASVAGAAIWGLALYFASPVSVIVLILGRTDSERPSDWLLRKVTGIAQMEDASVGAKVAVAAWFLVAGVAASVVGDAAFGDSTWQISSGLGFLTHRRRERARQTQTRRRGDTRQAHRPIRRLLRIRPKSSLPKRSRAPDGNLQGVPRRLPAARRVRPRRVRVSLARRQLAPRRREKSSRLLQKLVPRQIRARLRQRSRPVTRENQSQPPHTFPLRVDIRSPRTARREFSALALAADQPSHRASPSPSRRHVRPRPGPARLPRRPTRLPRRSARSPRLALAASVPRRPSRSPGFRRRRSRTSGWISRRARSKHVPGTVGTETEDAEDVV